MGRVLVAVGAGLVPAAAWAASLPSEELGARLPIWSAIPFAGVLLSIALFPLFAPAFWHHHYPKVAAAWALALLGPFTLVYRGEALHELAHIAIVDYVPFIILLGALFTVGGGIFVRGTLTGTPWVNVGLLATGTALASWVGTTGAAMVLVRPLLRANRERRRKVHTIVVFIFLVANVGGALSPLGDPPLFLGFLHGVPFFWTLSLWPPMLFVALWILGVYAALDAYHWRREDPMLRERRAVPGEPLGLEGWHNLFLLGGILAAVVASGLLSFGEVVILGVHQQIDNLLRDAMLVLLILVSWVTTPRRVREANEFTWEPIREVAILFAGIFATIIPALAMLRAGEHGALAPLIRSVRDPAHFFWATGILSSFLDNAPTYLTFFSTALGRLYPGVPEQEAVARLLSENAAFLTAIASGAVFMGANTYIGNAPNFMVKSIAEESGVPMPSFFGYMLRYSMPMLIPAFLVATWLFFE